MKNLKMFVDYLFYYRDSRRTISKICDLNHYAQLNGLVN